LFASIFKTYFSSTPNILTNMCEYGTFSLLIFREFRGAYNLPEYCGDFALEKA